MSKKYALDQISIDLDGALCYVEVDEKTRRAKETPVDCGDIVYYGPFGGVTPSSVCLNPASVYVMPKKYEKPKVGVCRL